MRQEFRAALQELAQLDKRLDLQGALRLIIATDARVLGIARVSFWDLAVDHREIRCRVLYERDRHDFSSGTVLRAADFPAYFDALIESRTIAAVDAWSDPRTSEFTDAYLKPLGIRSMLDIPVWRDGRLVGVVCHEHVGGVRTWTEEEHSFGASICNLISVALETADRQRAETGYALLARVSNDVLRDWDLLTDRIQWSEAIYSALRFRAEDVGGTSAWWHDHIHPDDRARVTKTLTEALGASNSPGWNEQYRWFRGDGTLAVIVDRGHVVRDVEGKAVRMLGSMLDISERLELQSRLALSDRMASIGTLAAGVAHEINNPLTYVIANLTCAIEDLRSAPTFQRTVELLREAYEGADRVRNVMKDLQLFSRPKSDDDELLDVQSVIESSVNIARSEIRHRAQLVIRYSAGTPKVSMNRARLGQVVLNLLVNAAHAIPEGDVNRHQITIRTLASAEGDAVIEIRDTGVGIAPEHVERVFEPFFTTKPMGVGTGLGLSICHSIVSTTGGSLAIESVPGQGTVIRVTLPAASDDTVRAAEVAKVPAIPRMRILLVDDEGPVRRSIRRLLEPEHEVHVADGGAAALEALASQDRYDAILCDIVMPEVTGMDVYDRLVETGAACVDRMIFMTGGAFSARAAKFVGECGLPVLDKPLDRNVLRRALMVAATAVG